MKSMTSLILTLTVIFTSAHANAVTPSEFVKEFVAATNKRITLLNQGRAEAGEKTYCAKLSKVQIKLIQSVASEPNVTVGNFLNEVSEKLNCYPPFWAPWKRNTMRGFMFNTKSLVMDYQLIQGALEDLNGGQWRNDNEILF